MTGRRPPWSEESEKALIGVCMVTRDAIETAISIPVEPSDFYSPNLATIYRAILGLHAVGDPVDPTTVIASVNGQLGDKGPDLIKALYVDAPGSANATAYARTIRDHAQSRKLLTLAGDLQAAIFDGTDPGPILDELQAPDTQQGTSWAEVDIAPILDGDLTPPEPELFTREDGRHLLYAGVVHTFVGESESLKSWLALMAAAQEIKAGNDVLYIDFEDTPYSILGRLRSLGVPVDDLIAGFHYLRPEEPLHAGAIRRLERITEAWSPTLAVIDGVTEAMALEGLDPLDNAEVATWQARLPRRLANHGPAVVMIDHVTKSKENRGRYALGAQHKLAGIYVQYLIDPIHPMAHVPDGSLDPITGVSKITVEKDRYGAIRGYAVARRNVGEVHLTAYPDGGVTGHIYPAIDTGPEGFRPTHVMEKVSKALKKAKTPLNKRALFAAVSGRGSRKDTVELALSLLASEGYIAIDKGDRGSILHRHVRDYLEKNDHTEDDDQEEQRDGDAF